MTGFVEIHERQLYSNLTQRGDLPGGGEVE